HGFVDSWPELARRQLGRRSGQQPGIDARDRRLERVQNLRAEQRSKGRTAPQRMLEIESAAQDWRGCLVEVDAQRDLLRYIRRQAVGYGRIGPGWGMGRARVAPRMETRLRPDA